MPDNDLAAVNAKVDELSAALTTEKQQVADLLAEKDSTIATLNETIAQLEAAQAEGGTAEDRAAIIAKLTTLKTELEATVPPAGNEGE